MGLKCGVYWNSHKRLFSIRNEDTSTRELPDFHYGKVIAHAQHVWMGASSFQVSEAGRERANDEGRKNVHARVLGDVIAIGGQWHFPHSTLEGGKLLSDTYYRIDIFRATFDLISARVKVDDHPSLGASGIWRQTGATGLSDSDPGTHTVHYTPWAGPAGFTTFTNDDVWSVEASEAVELSCMIAKTDSPETLRRPCVVIPAVGSVLRPVEQPVGADHYFAEVTQTI